MICNKHLCFLAKRIHQKCQHKRNEYWREHRYKLCNSRNYHPDIIKGFVHGDYQNCQHKNPEILSELNEFQHTTSTLRNIGHYPDGKTIRQMHLFIILYVKTDYLSEKCPLCGLKSYAKAVIIKMSVSKNHTKQIFPSFTSILIFEPSATLPARISSASISSSSD